MADISSQGRGGAMMAEISMMDCLIILGNYSRREELQERKIRRMETDNGEDDDDDDDNDDDDNDDGSCMVVFRLIASPLPPFPRRAVRECLIGKIEGKKPSMLVKTSYADIWIGE
ncbi:hypothetical protein IWX49DRAFT_549159 [Phyllosticta citricarpa]